MHGRPPGLHVSLLAAVGMAMAATAFALGLVLAPWSPRIHIAMAGLAGGYVFPSMVYVTLVTVMASGLPRRGLEAAIAILSVAAPAAVPLSLVVAGPLEASVVLAFGAAAKLAYAAMQLRRPRMTSRDFKHLVPAPPAGLLTASLAVIARGDPGVEEIAAAAFAGFTMPAIALLSPATVSSVYKPGRVWRLASQHLSLAGIPGGVILYLYGPEAALAAGLVAGLLYLAPLLHMAPSRLSARGATRYIATSHLSAAVAAVAGLAHLATSGPDFIALVHSAYAGFAGPHAVMHVTVRGGEVPLTVKPRFWPVAAPTLLALSAILRPYAPPESWLLALSAVATLALAIASPSLVPPSFRQNKLRLE